MKSPFSRTAFDLLTEIAGRDAEALAVIDRGRAITYRDLARRAGQVAAALRGHGLTRGHKVGVLLDNRVEWLEIAFGAAALGCIVVPISTWVKKSELAFILEDASVSVLFAMDTYAGQTFGDDIESLRRAHAVPTFERIVGVGGAAREGWTDYEPFIDVDPLGPLPPGIGAKTTDTMFVLYTSGSSNRPKAVPLAQAAALENGFNIGERQ